MGHWSSSKGGYMHILLVKMTRGVMNQSLTLVLTIVAKPRVVHVIPPQDLWGDMYHFLAWLLLSTLGVRL